MDIGVWLNRLELKQYEQAFRENDVDDEVLPELTAEDLVGIGVTSIGHRRKILRAIAALREEAVPAAERTEPFAGPTTEDLYKYSPSTTAERRQLTVMFCDLVGSTALSARLDPEDLRDIIAAYHRTITEIITATNGFVSRYMGDGVLAYFGYPQAHEDDAERAVRAGLGAIEAVSQIDAKFGMLQARVGIATGLVVVGDLIGAGPVQEQSVVGETPNLAARLQALAEPGTVVIAASTHRLVGALFEYRDLEAVAVKGLASPVTAWQVLRPNAVVSRFEALRGVVLTRLVGRDEEIELLVRRWTRAKAGDGQIVLVSGEAGIGKSHIASILHERISAEPGIRLRYYCTPYHRDSALFPFVDQLGRTAGFGHDDPPEIKLQKLETLLACAMQTGEDLALLADLISLPSSERHPLPHLSAQRKKERALEALIRHLEGFARRDPVLMIFEDAHWIDPTSLELLDLIVERVRGLPVLLVVTFRPEFQPPWTGQPRVSMLVLNRLDRDDRATMVLQLARGKSLPSEIVDQIVDRTDGVPLFVEELTKSIIESGLLREEADHYVLDGPLLPLAIPTSLHDSLMARLDRLSSVRQVAQIAAAIGREFSYTLLRAVSPLAESDLQVALARLVASELVFQRGTLPEAVYAFKHSLVQDAAHGSLLRDARQQLHGRIAEALEVLSPGLIDSQPELFAQHYAEAGLVEKSVAFWDKAGHSSAARSAMAEAAAQLQKGLDQLALLPETPERRRQELEVCSALGAALRFVKGAATPGMGKAFARAKELWEQLGSPSEFLHIPYGQSFYHIRRGEFELAQRLDEELLRLSRQRNDTAGLVLGHASAGRTLMYAGQFAPARLHLEEVLTLYDPVSHAALGHQSGSHPRLGARGQLGIALFCLGFPDQALAQSDAAVTEASAMAHAPSVAASLAMAARLLSLGGDHATLDQRASQLITVATEQGFPSYRAVGTIYRGWGKVIGGDVEQGIALLRSGASAYNATGAKSRVSFHIALLAKACELAEQHDEALTMLDDALQIAERMGERWFTAELNRQKGDVLYRRGLLEAAETFWRTALMIAEEQQAKLWQLRAAVSLARFSHDQLRRAKARSLLATIYGWFSEGFAAQDLQRAKAVIDGLR